jgi:mono/diheme cytochrome c family protein
LQAIGFKTRSFGFLFVVVVLAGSLYPVSADETASGALERGFSESVQPFLKTYCHGCHGTTKQEGKLDLSGYASLPSVVKNYAVWEIVLERLEAGDMPPKKAPKHPVKPEYKTVIDWIKSVRDLEAARNAGDPGPVLARRLSNSEFDYTIRDLTGVNIRPTKEFPVDPANEAGFDNSGESLSMSPALVKKYLAAARLVADHVVLQTQGFTFAPHPVVTETDRDKFCVQRIVDFYQRHQVDYADYFHAAWNFKNREILGKPNATLIDFARESKLSPKYLGVIWSALSEPSEIGPLAELQAEWNKLPVAKSADEALSQRQTVRQACERLRDLVIKLRKQFDSKVEKLHVKGNSDGSQPLVLWWNRQIAIQRMSCHGDGKEPQLDAARARFCAAFPNTFSVSSRGHYADPDLGVGVRLLTAGFHLMQGYFRDDTPLYELVLDDAGKQELDTLWRELNFVTLVPFRQYKDFLFFERAEPPRFAGGPEFDFARPEDKDVTSEAKLKQMCEAYLNKARKNKASDQAIEAIQTYFANMSTDCRWIEQAHHEAESSHLKSLVAFAERAYRRPLASNESDELVAFYQRTRRQDGLNHEDAIRDCIASVLLSPHFCYRFDLAPKSQQAEPLSDYALASRLSYFIWSSMPDQELLSHAAAGNLHQPDILLAQTRRMLQDPKVQGMATEFGGNWLDFRRFEEHNSVDRERFSSFTNELRQAMFEEPIHYFVDVANHNRSVLDFLYADHTFVNPVLAKHYGMNHVQAHTNEWVRVDQAQQFGRGGLLPMSVFLTNNSPGLRTSPVKRGYWVVRRLLGEHIPAPPPDVPELPKDESKLGELTLPQLLSKHREHKNCAVCHDRFDSIGLVFEGYGPIGEKREKDLGGRAIESKATFPNGQAGTGFPGLRDYLQKQRQKDFVDNLNKKLLAYGLGRSLMLSDQALLQQMATKLEADEYRFGSIVETIVTSPQFLNHRGSESVNQ